MATTTASDPYKILGVDKDADSVAIKKAYRKLVLSCHPDKVTDESLKAEKQEEFHQIQQAYETVGDPDNRIKYELELKAKKVKEEKDRSMPKGSPAQSRNVNINIYTAQHPSEHRSSSKYSPSKSASYKPYSADFAKSWEHSLPTRSKTYEAERKTRRTYSDERLNEDSRERKRRDEDRRRRQEDEDERRRRQAKRERDAVIEREREREMKERARAKENARKREREEREERLRAEARAERKSRERAAAERDSRRRQEADEKLRSKMRSHEHTSEEDDDRKSRSKKSSKKDSPRDKTPSKARERTTPRQDVVPELPTAAEQLESKAAYESKIAYAADYIRNQQVKKNTKSSSKHATEAPSFSDAYPDPNKWVRHVSGEKTPKVTAEPASIDDATSPSSTPQAPPRLHKSYTMGHVPTSDARPSMLGRAQTFDAEAFSRHMGSERAERPRLNRQRTTVDEDDYYSTPRVQKYSVGRDKGQPRVFETTPYRDPYAPGGTFPKVKTAPAYGPEHLNYSKRHDTSDVMFADYNTPGQQPYVATHS